MAARSKPDPEVAAISAITRALTSLPDDAARARVILYLNQRINPALGAAPKSAS